MCGGEKLVNVNIDYRAKFIGGSLACRKNFSA